MSAGGLSYASAAAGSGGAPLHTNQMWWVEFRAPETHRDVTRSHLPNEIYDRRAGILINTDRLYREQPHRSASVTPLTAPRNIDEKGPFQEVLGLGVGLGLTHIILYDNATPRLRPTRSLVLSDLATTVDVGRLDRFIRRLSTAEFRAVTEAEMTTIVCIAFVRAFTGFRINIVPYSASYQRRHASKAGRGT